MNGVRVWVLALVIAFSLAVAGESVSGAESDLKSDLARLQGKWKGTLTSDDVTTFWSLDIQGNKTKLSVKSKNGDEITKVECDFKLEQQGRFRSFTYWNVKYLSGDRQGQTDLTEGKTRLSVYKFESQDSFTTVGGFGDDDDGPHLMIRWEKVK